MPWFPMYSIPYLSETDATQFSFTPLNEHFNRSNSTKSISMSWSRHCVTPVRFVITWWMQDMRFCVFQNSDYYTLLLLCAPVMSSCVLVSQDVIIIYHGFRHSCNSRLTTPPVVNHIKLQSVHWLTHTVDILLTRYCKLFASSSSMASEDQLTPDYWTLDYSGFKPLWFTLQGFSHFLLPVCCL